MDHPRITPAPDVLAGKPVIRGTRLSVEFVIGLMADGWSEADILENYPSITHEDILACLALCSRYTELGESVSERGLILRFLANENFPAAAVASLAADGHDVVWMRIVAPAMPDTWKDTWQSWTSIRPWCCRQARE
jgi:uncharacterized protein (DUF433 family)